MRLFEEHIPRKIINDQCFLIMPFSMEWSERISNFIKEVLSEFGMQGIRADDIYREHILRNILENLYRSRIIIADLTGRNANVFYEVGIAHAKEKDIILIAQNAEDIPFDLSQSLTIIYNFSDNGLNYLKTEVKKALKQLLYKDLVDNFGEKIENDEFILLYVSEGGTCRCAMSNMITRNLLKDYPEVKVRSVSVAAAQIQSDEEEASFGAMYAVKNRLKDASVNFHKTRFATFEYWKRADLILLTSLSQQRFIPKIFRNKMALLSDFYGGSERIFDPYGMDVKQYGECFEILYKQICGGFEKLIETYKKTT